MSCTGTSSGELSPAQASGDSEGTPVRGWIEVEVCLAGTEKSPPSACLPVFPGVFHSQTRLAAATGQPAASLPIRPGHCPDGPVPSGLTRESIQH